MTEISLLGSTGRFGKERIAWHKKNIEKLTRKGRKTDLTEAMLDSWERILLVFEQHREVVLKWLQGRKRR